MAVIKTLVNYPKVLNTNNDTQFLIQVDLSNQRIKEITNLFIAVSGTFQHYEATVSEDIEQSYYDMIKSSDTTSIYYQFKNDVLSIVASEGTVSHSTDSFFFTATRYAQPIVSLEDDIDIPQSEIPLFVQKVLGNVYQLQGKEIPLSIQRKIKELE